MKKFGWLVLAFGLVFAGVAVADHHGAKEVTLEGTVLCAKCKMGEERDKCHNVLAVEKDGKTTHYYMAANEANTEFGDVCMATPAVRVTGMVEKRDGQHWIVASKIERVEES